MMTMFEEKYENLKGRYNAWWTKLATWTETQTKKICILCLKERPLSSPVPLTATHLAVSMQQCGDIAAVTPTPAPPVENSVVAATRSLVASVDQLVGVTADSAPPSPVASRVTSSVASDGSGKKRPMIKAEWQVLCRGWPDIWESPGKRRRWNEEYDRMH
jgi:hypothetical protein